MIRRRPIPRSAYVEGYYVYRWNRMGRKDQICKVLTRGSRNSCSVEFADGYKAVISRNALRRLKWCELHD